MVDSPSAPSRKRVTDDAVDVAILWNVPGKGAQLRAPNVQAVGTEIPSGSLPISLLSSANWEKRFPRLKTREVYVGLNFNGYTDSVRVAQCSAEDLSATIHRF
jgi:hypothetical protein